MLVTRSRFFLRCCRLTIPGLLLGIVAIPLFLMGGCAEKPEQSTAGTNSLAAPATKGMTTASPSASAAVVSKSVDNRVPRSGSPK